MSGTGCGHGHAGSSFTQGDVARSLAEASAVRLAVDTDAKTGLDGVADPFAAGFMRTRA